MPSVRHSAGAGRLLGARGSPDRHPNGASRRNQAPCQMGSRSWGNSTRRAGNVSPVTSGQIIGRSSYPVLHSAEQRFSGERVAWTGHDRQLDALDIPARHFPAQVLSVLWLRSVGRQSRQEYDGQGTYAAFKVDGAGRARVTFKSECSRRSMISPVLSEGVVRRGQTWTSGRV